jgi:nucleoside phosphorylase/Flp pilus assembly protein TadD
VEDGPQNYDCLIATAIAEEWHAVCKRLKDPYKPTDQLLPVKAGRIGGHHVLCVLTGKGQENTASSLQRALDKSDIPRVLFVGIAGGLPEKGIRRGDVVFAKHVYSFDFGKLTTGQFIRRPDLDFSCDRALLAHAEVVAAAPGAGWASLISETRPDKKPCKESRAISGYIGSSNKIVDDQDHSLFEIARQQIPELHAVEMEAAGAGATIRLVQAEKHLSFLMIRGVSDIPQGMRDESSGTEQRERWTSYAVDAAAAFAEALLEGTSNNTGKDSLAKLRLQKHQMESAFKTLNELRATLPTRASQEYTIAVNRLKADIDSIDRAIARLNPLERTAVLPRRPRCIGRDIYLEQIQTYVEDEKWRPSTISIEGPGGIGKTVLAQESAHRASERGRYDQVIWVSAKREEIVDGLLTPIDKYINTFVDILDALGEAYELKDFSILSPARKQSMIEKYMAAIKTLLIVDNLETVPDWELAVLARFLATLPAPSRALCTSRRPLRNGSIPIRVDCFSPAESDVLIQAISAERNVELPHNVIREIYRVTGGLPLAINLLTALVCRRWLGEADALSRIQSMPDKKLLDFIFGSSYNTLDPDGQGLLKVAALFHEKTAPSKKAARIVAQLEEEAAERAEDQLLDLSLFDGSRNDNEVNWGIHPLLRRFVRNKTETNEKRAFATRYAKYLEDLDPKQGIHVFTRDYELMCVRGNQPTVLEFAFMIHTQVGERIKKAFVDDVEVEFERPLQHGNVIEIKVSNRPARLKPEYSTIVTAPRTKKRLDYLIHQQSYDSAVADAKVMTGNGLSKRGRVDESIRAYDKAVRMHPESSWGLNRLSQALRIAGEYDRAASLHEEILQVDDANAYAKCGLGLIAYIQGHTEEATAFFLKALRCRNDYVNAMFGLARVMCCCGKYRDALVWLQKAEEKQSCNPRILLFTALVLAELGDSKQSYLVLDSALNMFARIGTPTGSHGLYYHSLALVLANSDNYKDVLTKARKLCFARGVRREILRDVSFVTSSALSIFDSMALPTSERNAAGRLTKFRQALE